MGTAHGDPPPIPAWLNDLQEVVFSPLSSLFLPMLERDLLHPKALLPAGDSLPGAKVPKEPQLHFPSRKTPLGVFPVLSRDRAPPCPTPLPGLIRHFGKSLLPVFPPCRLWSSQEHQAPSSPLIQVLVSVSSSSSWDVFQDVETPAMNGFAGIPLEMRNFPSIQQVPAQDKPGGC